MKDPLAIAIVLAVIAVLLGCAWVTVWTVEDDVGSEQRAVVRGGVR